MHTVLLMCNLSFKQHKLVEERLRWGSWSSRWVPEKNINSWLCFWQVLSESGRRLTINRPQWWPDLFKKLNCRANSMRKIRRFFYQPDNFLENWSVLQYNNKNKKREREDGWCGRSEDLCLESPSEVRWQGRTEDSLCLLDSEEEEECCY